MMSIIISVKVLEEDDEELEEEYDVRMNFSLCDSQKSVPANKFVTIFVFVMMLLGIFIRASFESTTRGRVNPF